MAAEENPTTPPAGGNELSAEDRMTILQRRLAEIQNRAADAPASTPSPESGAQIELPAQGTPELPANQPAGAGTAEPTGAAVMATDLGTAAPDAGTPEAASAAETAQHVPDSVTVDGSDISASQARALAHYGAADQPTPSPETLPAAEQIASATPAPIADPEVNSLPAPELPVATLQSAEAIEAAPEAIATLPASSETPAPESTDEAESASRVDASEVNPIGEDATADSPAADGSTVDAAPAKAIVSPTASEAAVLTEGAVEEMPDFTGLDLPAQAAYLVGLLRRPDSRNFRKQIQDLTRQYEANVGQARTAAREKFAAGGEGAEAFAFQQPEGQQELNKAQQEYRESRVKDAKAEDASRGDNLTRKKALLDQLRLLVEAAETKDSSAKLKALQAEWKATGAVPQTDSQSNLGHLPRPARPLLQQAGPVPADEGPRPSPQPRSQGSAS